jgi:ribonuclease R
MAPPKRKSTRRDRRASGGVPARAPEPPSPSGLVAGELYTGIFQFGGHGGGFVVLEDRAGPDIFVPLAEALSALHGDQVRVRLNRFVEGRAPVGEVERVLRHANKFILGQINRSRRISVVRPKSTKLGRMIEIQRQFPQGEVPDGAWVMVEITSWPRSPGEPLQGKLSEVLGVEGDRRLPILLLLREKGVIPEFPEKVEIEAKTAAGIPIVEEEIRRRKDFRSERVVTIDPKTAKDFDDAINLFERTKGRWRVGVHIADVSHYVHPGTDLDNEAYARATSIYPVDRVIPMLPEVLSNGACSLNPGEDKLVMSAVFTIHEDGSVTDVEIHNGVIRSMRRFYYQEVQGLFDRKDGIEDSRHPAPEIPEAMLSDLFDLREAAMALRRQRERRGALDLDLPEAEFVFGKDGEIEDIGFRERLEAHRLIEDLMIAANEAVARELTRAKLPVLYRVHEEPDEAKLLALRPAFNHLGIRLPEGKIDQSHLQQALNEVAKQKAGRVLQRWVLRALPRAVYQGKNVGHFGLASTCYAHFTSPIRRYPDLITHRASKALIASPLAREDWVKTADGHLAEWGRHTSSREEASQKIEWDAEKIVAYEFMKRHLGEVFDGFVSGAIGKGFFVEFEHYPVEGFVLIRSLDDDFYDLDDKNLTWVGRRSGRTFTVGDPVKVLIERVDPLMGEMDLYLVRKSGKKVGPKPDAGRRKTGKYDWKKHVKPKRGRRG